MEIYRIFLKISFQTVKILTSSLLTSMWWLIFGEWAPIVRSPQNWLEKYRWNTLFINVTQFFFPCIDFHHIRAFFKTNEFGWFEYCTGEKIGKTLPCALVLTFLKFFPLILNWFIYLSPNSYVKDLIYPVCWGYKQVI